MCVFPEKYLCEHIKTKNDWQCIIDGILSYIINIDCPRNTLLGRNKYKQEVVQNLYVHMESCSKNYTRLALMDSGGGCVYNLVSDMGCYYHVCVCIKLAYIISWC